MQIAAVSNSDKFTEYILPSQTIAPSASAVTGLQMRYITCSSHKRGFNIILAWLSERKPCVLIGHNFKQFELPRIIRALETCNLTNTISDSVIGIVDTLPLYRELFPSLISNKQELSVSEILHMNNM